MALTFTQGSNDNVNHGSPAEIDDLSAGTVMAWVKPDNNVSTTSHGIADKDGEFIFLITGTDIGGTDGELSMIRLRDTTNQTSESTPNKLTLDVWNFVAGTFDIAATSEVYWGTTAVVVTNVTDTQENGSGTKTGNATGSLRAGNIASAPIGGSTGFDGDIGFMHVCNTQLSLEDIREQQFRPRPRADSVLFSHYGWYGATGANN